MITKWNLVHGIGEHTVLGMDWLPGTKRLSAQEGDEFLRPFFANFSAVLRTSSICRRRAFVWWIEAGDEKKSDGRERFFPPQRHSGPSAQRLFQPLMPSFSVVPFLILPIRISLPLNFDWMPFPLSVRRFCFSVGEALISNGTDRRLFHKMCPPRRHVFLEG